MHLNLVAGHSPMETLQTRQVQVFPSPSFSTRQTCLKADQHSSHPTAVEGLHEPLINKIELKMRKSAGSRFLKTLDIRHFFGFFRHCREANVKFHEENYVNHFTWPIAS